MADVTSEETARRVEEARRFRHSTEMGGGRVPDPAQQDIAAYARGEVDEAEMLRRARQRYGLDGLPAHHNAECSWRVGGGEPLVPGRHLVGAARRTALPQGRPGAYARPAVNEARQMGIEGRSKMNKAELQRAVDAKR